MENKYEFYLIDRLKDVSDKLREVPEGKKEERLILLNIFEENMEALVQFRNLNNFV